MTQPDPKIDRFLARATSWQDELTELRRICLDNRLEESMKWGKPCYSFQGGNVAITQPFTFCCALMFFKGVLLDDPAGLLKNVGERSRSAKRIEFFSVEEIKVQEPALIALIERAIEVELSGAKVDFEKDAEVEVPDELQVVLDTDPEFRTAFHALTPGRQRGYLLYFSDAKQSKTRSARIEKSAPRILEGLGIHD